MVSKVNGKRGRRGHGGPKKDRNAWAGAKELKKESGGLSKEFKHTKGLSDNTGAKEKSLGGKNILGGESV